MCSSKFYIYGDGLTPAVLKTHLLDPITLYCTRKGSAVTRVQKIGGRTPEEPVEIGPCLETAVPPNVDVFHFN